MKKLIAMAFAVAMIATGCKKETETGTMKAHVGISMEQMEKSTTLSRNTDRLCWQVLQNGSVVASGTQANTASDYGNISVDLAVGSYTLVVMGNYGDAPTMNANGTFTYTKVGNGYAGYANFTISRNERTNVNIGLVRVVSKLTLTSTDQMPQGVAQWHMVVDSICSTYDVVTSTGSGKVRYETQRLNASANSSGVFSKFTYLMTEGSSGTVNVRLLFFGSNGDTLFDRHYENIPVERNYQTTLTSAMFHEHGGDGNVTIDTTWSGTHNVDL